MLIRGADGLTRRVEMIWMHPVLIWMHRFATSKTMTEDDLSGAEGDASSIHVGAMSDVQSKDRERVVDDLG